MARRTKTARLASGNVNPESEPDPRGWSATEHLAGDDDLLNLAGAFVDPQRANLPVESLDGGPTDNAAGPEQLDRTVDDLLRRLGGDQLGHGRFTSDAGGALVARPG